MADITPARIEPLGGDAENSQEDSRRGARAKPKPAVTRTPAPPPVESDEDESHQLDEQA